VTKALQLVDMQPTLHFCVLCERTGADSVAKSAIPLALNPSTSDHAFALTQNTCAHILCSMNVTLSIDEQLIAPARKKADALGKSLNQLIRDYLQKLAGGDDPERSIEEFRKLSRRGHSRGWRFNRNEIHERP
jgi:hypothetical protein